MKKTIVCCDLCGVEGAKEIGFFVGRFPDPAGSSEDRYETIDLCPDHVLYAMSIAKSFLIPDQSKAIIEKLKQTKRT